MGHLQLGQFRRVRYTDDGCSIYQSMWCKCSFETRDDPEYQWNFCPKCSRSWFKKMECRDHDTPRWVWDRYRDDPHVDWYRPPKKATYRWVIEGRSQWPEMGKVWGSWGHHNNVYGNCWQDAKRQLEQERAYHAPSYDGDIVWEFRARIYHG